MGLPLKHDQLPKESAGDAPHPADGVASSTLSEFERVLRHQTGVILATFIVLMAVAVAIISSLTPRYVASVLIEIDPRHTEIVASDGERPGRPADIETIQTEMKTIESRKIARRAIDELKLGRDPEINRALRAAPITTRWRNEVATWLASLADGPGDESRDDAGDARAVPAEDEDSLGIRAALGALAAMLEPSRDPGLTSEQERVRIEEARTIDAFLSRLEVFQEGRSRVLRVSFASRSPRTAAAVANKVADLYIDDHFEANFEATRRASAWLNERVEELRQEIAAKERAVAELRAGSGLRPGGRDAMPVSERKARLYAQHDQELMALAEAEARLRRVEGLLESPQALDSALARIEFTAAATQSGAMANSSLAADVDSIREVLSSPLIVELRREGARLERDIAQLSAEHGERHPRTVNARAELRDMRAMIRTEVDRIVEDLRNEIAAARSRVATLDRALRELDGHGATPNGTEGDLRSLEQEAEASRTLLETLLRQSAQTSPQENLREPNADIISYASPPEQPSFPRKDVLFPLAFFGALAQGFFLAFFMERLDRGVRSTDQVERLLRAVPLGEIPLVTKPKGLRQPPHAWVLDNPASAFGEAIRGLHANILLSDASRRPKVVLVTSSLPREGKTTISLSLARLLAKDGHKVIVVDCHLRRSSAPGDLALSAGRGLAECLTDGVAADEVIQQDETSDAHFLHAGASGPNPPELFDSPAMQGLLTTLGQRYELVILDAAPVLTGPDTLFLARLADKTVFVVRSARTKRESAIKALNQLLAAQADLAGVLLTMVDVKRRAA